MLLRQVVYFLAVVDCHSFTEAAEQCYISQSAISQQVQALERDIGTDLLLREGRSFTLTPAGEYFYLHGKELVMEAERLVQRTRDIGGQAEERLRIGYLGSYSGQELAQVVAEFSESHPDIAVGVIAGTHEELYTRLRSGEIDMALSDQRRAFSERYENFFLARGACCGELSVRHPLAAKDIVDIGELTGETCILIASRAEHRHEAEYYRNTLGFQTSFLFAESLDEGRMMAVGNRGILPIERVGSLPDPKPGLCRRLLYRGGQPLYREYCLFWPKERHRGIFFSFARVLQQMVLSSSHPIAPV